MPQDLDTKLVLIIDKSEREICICTIVIRTDVSIPNLDRVSITYLLHRVLGIDI